MISKEVLVITLLFFLNFINMKFVSEKMLRVRVSQKTLINGISKINSIIHSIIIVIVSSNFINNKISEETFIANLTVTRAFLLYDFITMCFYYNYFPGVKLALLHHLVFFIGMHVNTINIYPQLAAQGLRAEITNIPLYFGWFLIKVGMMRHPIFVLNAFMLLTLFFVYRVYNFTQLFLIAFGMRDTEVETSVLCVIMLLNIYWFTKLLEKFYTSVINI